MKKFKTILALALALMMILAIVGSGRAFSDLAATKILLKVLPARIASSTGFLPSIRSSVGVFSSLSGFLSEKRSAEGFLFIFGPIGFLKSFLFSLGLFGPGIPGLIGISFMRLLLVSQ